MKIISIRSQIREVAKRWKAQYSGPPWAYQSDKRKIGEKLAELDPETATAEDVAAIIGNSTWVAPTKCGECAEFFPTVIMVGEPVDCESRTAYLCVGCLQKAVTMLLAGE